MEENMIKSAHSHEWWLPYLRECKEKKYRLTVYCKEKELNFDAFYWHWRKEYGGTQNNVHGTELLPVIITPSTVSESKVKLEINGIDVDGDVKSIRRILGIES
jgi:hypothetical protein